MHGVVSKMQSLPRGGLLVQGGLDEGKMISLFDGITSIGRSPLSDVVVDEPSVSRQHAAIQIETDGSWISDLDSHNGTFVNGARIGQTRQRLSNWDRIQLGGMETHWVFMESQETIDVPKPT